MDSPFSTSGQHDHSFGQKGPKAGERRTFTVIAITATMMVVEIASGLAFGSMALLADGLHMGSHTVALGIAAFAYVYARRHAHDRRFSFGTGKVNALAGFTGAILLAGFAVLMAVESVDRLLHPVEIVFDQALLVATLGLVVNGACVFILDTRSGGEARNRVEHDDDHNHDHNLRAAYLHVLADALTSLLAILALLAAKFLGAMWMDPMMGVVGAVLVAHWSLGLLRDTSKVLLDWQASEPLLRRVAEVLEEGGECQLTDLHVWSIGPGLFAAEVALVSRQPKPAAFYRRRLENDLGMAHATVEVHHECNESSKDPTASDLAHGNPEH